MAVRLDEDPANMRFSTEASRHCSPIYTATSSFFTRAEDMGVGQSALEANTDGSRRAKTRRRIIQQADLGDPQVSLRLSTGPGSCQAAKC